VRRQRERVRGDGGLPASSSLGAGEAQRASSDVGKRKRAEVGAGLDEWGEGKKGDLAWEMASAVLVPWEGLEVERAFRKTEACGQMHHRLQSTVSG